MRVQIFILLYGVVIMVKGYPIYDYDDYEGNNDYVDEPMIYQQRTPRSLEGVIKKTSRGAINMARQFIRTFLPSAAQIGYQGVRRMAKRSTPFNPPLPAATTATLLPMTNGFYNYNYQYPGMGMASYYNYPGAYAYGGYQYPYSMYGADKRNYMPYAYTNSYYTGVLPQKTVPQLSYAGVFPQKTVPQQPYSYQYPAAMATYTAVKQTIANTPERSSQIKPKDHEKEAEKHPSIIPDTSTANGISQGLIDLENDVNGFNQAIQFMKEAFIEDNNDGSSDLEEKIHEDKNDVMGVKKDLIKKKKTSAELLEAFKRTLDSKEKLENKLVNYFTNYVCGDDC